MEELKFKLQVFEGPLDLLLHLALKHKIELTDIPIAEITEQYIAYLDQMARMDMEITGDFLSMASHLIYIKSCALLPKPEIVEEDPKEELEERLRLYKAAKEAAGQLENIQFSTIDNYFKGPENLGDAPIENENISIEKLMKAFLQVTERLEEKAPPRVANFKEIVRVQRVSLTEQISYVGKLLKKGEVRHFSQIFEGITTRDGRIATFLAVLHLVSRGKIYIEERNEEIYLYGGEGA
ncbi:MAG: segregation/condensation protein A [Clostridia bacterium]|nr:hypothetical protein [Oscillospiraceae bacterium]MBQ7032180.1 segregation/condensation protein A [Clostridia bacterium]